MIDHLPTEIILQVVGHLPTISSILNLSCTNKKLHQLIQKESSSIFHQFVNRSFPTIPVQAPWQKAAFDLTTRSRAFDRSAFIARECATPSDTAARPQQLERRYAGCAPVIDSYETTSVGVASSKEVLAWGVAGRLWLRTTRGQSASWSYFKSPEDHESWMDILDLRLMRPHQNRNLHGETILIRRANGETDLLHSSAKTDKSILVSRYQTPGGSETGCVDVSNGADPKLAVCNSGTLRLYPVHSVHASVPADLLLKFPEHLQTKQRKRSVKFLGDSRIAVSMQYLEGRIPGPIQIFDLETAQASSQLESSMNLSTTDREVRNNANVLVNLNESCTASNVSENLLLAGCSDGLVRLYDLRNGPLPVRKYWDPVDDGQILSLVAVGQERFFAGSHQNACLKMFDMRMGASVYHYTGTAPSPAIVMQTPKAAQTLPSRSRRDINIFLALPVYRSQQLWRPLPQRNLDRCVRYRGSIYSLSSPSSSSRTLYAGIENHVIQLDFVNTDDYVLNRGRIRDTIDLRWILNLSCYERPRTGHESTDAVLLRTQRDWAQSRSKLIDGEPGWDERWRLEKPRDGFRSK